MLNRNTPNTLVTACALISAALVPASAAQAFPSEGVPPRVENVSSAGVTSNQATILGTVNGDGFSASFTVEYGIAGHDFPWETQYHYNVGYKPYPLHEILNFSSLYEGTTFQYRVRAWSAAGTTYGPIQTFHTEGKPVIEGTGVIWPTPPTAAVFFAYINPNGSQSTAGEVRGTSTTYEFEYVYIWPLFGWRTAYPSTGPQGYPTYLPPGTGVLALSEELAEGGSYEYRARACNGLGCTETGWRPFDVPRNQ
jgi:hypothetical protein